jgi:hypothetical protein
MSTKSTKSSKVAVFCVHGMGQQMRFETLTQLGEGIRRVEYFGYTKCDNPQCKNPQCDYCKKPTNVSIEHLPKSEKAQSVIINGQLRQRYEMTLQGRSCSAPKEGGEDVVTTQQELELHLYEGYWASIPEGRVHFRDVIWFLFGGAWNGIKQAFQPNFKRWMFDDWQKSQIKQGTFWHIIITLFVVIFLLALDLGAVALTSHLLVGSPDISRWFSKDYIGFVTWVLAWLSITLIFVGVFWAAIALRKRLSVSVNTQVDYNNSNLARAQRGSYLVGFALIVVGILSNLFADQPWRILIPILSITLTIITISIFAWEPSGRNKFSDEAIWTNLNWLLLMSCIYVTPR